MYLAISFILNVIDDTPIGPSEFIDLKEPADGIGMPYKPVVVEESGDTIQQVCAKSDFFCGDVYYSTIPPTVDVSGSSWLHKGYFNLSDIIDGGSLADVEIDYTALASLNGGKLNSSNLKRIQDPRAGKGGAEVIEYSYVPATWGEVEAFISSNPGVPFYFNAKIPLKRIVAGVTQTAVIDVKLTYGTDTMQYTSFNEI